MILKKWEQLPVELQLEEVRPYYDILENKKISCVLKRVFDIVISCIMIAAIFPILLFISIAIKIDSPGPVFFRQERVTQYGKIFRIFKFRTMVTDAEKIGTQVTVNNDSRITKIGSFIRKYRLDELPQLFNVLKGDMSFVGTRPEVIKYVSKYSPEMMATLLMPAGVTSLASIKYKDESQLLQGTEDIDSTYFNKILPIKMKYNLESIETFSFLGDIKIMLMTIVAVLK